MITPGSFVEPIEDLIGYKKNVYAKIGELLQVKSVEFFPVLIVFHYGKPDNKFPANIKKINAIEDARSLEEKLLQIKLKEQAANAPISIKPIPKTKKRRR